jgi:hypothetical protein
MLRGAAGHVNNAERIVLSGCASLIPRQVSNLLP